MKKIKLMADYLCYPLWEVSPSINGDVSPELLPISDALRQALFAWSAQFDSTFETNDPPSSGFTSQKLYDDFIETGYDLVSRLKQELGSDYEVTHNIRAWLKPTLS